MNAPELTAPLPTTEGDRIVRTQRLDALIEQRAEIDRTISQLRAEVIADLRERIKGYGLTHDDIFGRAPTRRRNRGKK